MRRMTRQTGYKVWLDNKFHSYAFTFTSAHKLRVYLLAQGADPVRCYITKDRIEETAAPEW